MTDLGIVIVSYNTRDLLANCLDSVFRETERTSEVVVVDNASTDGSAEMVGRHFPTVRLVALDYNSGFAHAANLGVTLTGSRYVCLLNPDTVVHDHALDRLVDFAECHPEAGLCGGRTLRADGSVDPSSCWARATLWSLLCFATGATAAFRRNALFDPESMGHWDRDTVRPVDVVTGCLLAARRDVWEKLQGFDERFYIYGEDADLSLRAAEAGYHPAITPRATITHFVGAASGTRQDKGRLLMAGKITVIDKHWTPGRAAVGRALLLSGVGLRALASILSGRPSSWRQLWNDRATWSRGYPEEADPRKYAGVGSSPASARG